MEIPPAEHMVEFYSDDSLLLDSLEGFTVGGLRKGESVIVIATPSHREALDERLLAYGVNIDDAKACDHYITLDAERMLSKFMVDKWPDEVLFRKTVGELLDRARKGGRPVRAFGEMVALTWARGLDGATLQMERLWHQCCHEEKLSLFCAYPKSGFKQGPLLSIREICSTHSRILGEMS